MRKIVIATFEMICIVGVIIITFIGAFVAGPTLPHAAVGALLGFLFSSFVAGAAFTLLDIAASLRRLLKIEEWRLESEEEREAANAGRVIIGKPQH